MFKQRLFTASVLGAFVIAGILGLSTPHLALFMAAFVVLGAWEWARLAGVRRVTARIAYVGVIAALMWLCWRDLDMSAVVRGILYGALSWWVLAFLWLFNSRFASVADLPARLLKLCAGAAVLVPSWVALVWLHQGTAYGPYWLLYVLAMIAVADTGAYLAGRRWGKHKLAPAVSPGKTWEGVYGALVLVLLYASAGGYALGIRGSELVAFTAMNVILVPISVIGDLFESMVKRHAGMKDSGHLLPGHGGVLDRIDGLSAAAPLFVLGLIWLKINA